MKQRLLAHCLRVFDDAGAAYAPSIDVAAGFNFLVSMDYDATRTAADDGLWRQFIVHGFNLTHPLERGSVTGDLALLKASWRELAYAYAYALVRLRAVVVINGPERMPRDRLVCARGRPPERAPRPGETRVASFVSFAETESLNRFYEHWPTGRDPLRMLTSRGLTWQIANNLPIKEMRTLYTYAEPPGRYKLVVGLFGPNAERIHDGSVFVPLSAFDVPAAAAIANASLTAPLLVWKDGLTEIKAFRLSDRSPIASHVHFDLRRLLRRADVLVPAARKLFRACRQQPPRQKRSAPDNQ